MQPGERVAGRFEIEAEVGVGGSGTVYRGRDRYLQSRVAIKIVDADAVEDERRFAREGQILAGLTHPGIVGYVSHGSLGDRLYLVTEWVDGESLYQRLGGEGTTAREAVDIALAVAEGLGAAHLAGVLHRDVKPGNVLLAKGGAVKLIDFGIARAAGTGSRVTRSGMTVGTPGYMSPEQIRGTAALDARSDVFALGCLLFECLTGSPASARSNLVSGSPPRLERRCPEAPQELSVLVGRMLAHDPAIRPIDGAAAARRLAAIQVPPGPRRRRVDAAAIATESPEQKRHGGA